MSRSARSLNLAAWFLCAALLAVSNSAAVAQPVRTAIPPDLPVAEIEGFGFPRQIAGMPRGGKFDYRVPGLGFSVFYGKPGETWADIYVYDKQLDLSSGAPLALAKEELESALGDVREHVRLGNYQSATVQEQSTSGSFAKAHVKIVQAGRERDSFVFITVHKGKFVKIRLTSGSGANAPRIAESFLAEYSRMLKQP